MGLAGFDPDGGTQMLRRNVLGACASATVMVASLVATIGSAEATVYVITDQCSAGGFTGHIRVTVEFTGPTSSTVRRVEYKINEGSENGGNDGNPTWRDYGTMPTTVETTGNGIQDNQWHVLREANYNRGGGYNEAYFVFDKTWANDPECGTGVVIT